jgi:hypothetical protein
MHDYKGKALLVIIDGIGDVTIPAFGDRTPLEVAHTPNLDAIAGALALSQQLRRHLNFTSERCLWLEPLPTFTPLQLLA